MNTIPIDSVPPVTKHRDEFKTLPNIGAKKGFVQSEIRRIEKAITAQPAKRSLNSIRASVVEANALASETKPAPQSTGQSETKPAPQSTGQSETEPAPQSTGQSETEPAPQSTVAKLKRIIFHTVLKPFIFAQTLFNSTLNLSRDASTREKIYTTPLATMPSNVKDLAKQIVRVEYLQNLKKIKSEFPNSPDTNPLITTDTEEQRSNMYYIDVQQQELEIESLEEALTDNQKKEAHDEARLSVFSDLAEAASEQRNQEMKQTRKEISFLGAVLSSIMKRKGKTYEEVFVKFATKKLEQVNIAESKALMEFKELSTENKLEVYTKIVESASRSNPNVQQKLIETLLPR